jgi:hypothetical protein
VWFGFLPDWWQKFFGMPGYDRCGGAVAKGGDRDIGKMSERIIFLGLKFQKGVLT